MANAHILQPTPSSRHRFHLLDALRGVAALLVTLWHSNFIYSRGTHNTYLAVDFFFCLSGFVIAFSYERRLEAALTLRDFVATRFIRLYPMYAISMLAGIVVYLHYVHPVHVRTFLPLVLIQSIMLPNYVFRVNDLAFPFNFAAWSLFFEIVVNIVYAVLVQRGLAKLRHLMALIAGAVIVLVWQPGVTHRIDTGASASPREFFTGLARVTLSFCLGVLLLRLYRRRMQTRTSQQAHIVVASLLMAALIAVLQCPLGFMQREVFLFCDLLLLFPAIVFVGAYVEIPRIWQPACAFLGDVSYPIYLLNAALIPASETVYRHVYRSRQPLVPLSQTAVWLFLLGEVTFITAVAYACTRYFDLPMRLFLKRAYTRIQVRAT